MFKLIISSILLSASLQAQGATDAINIDRNRITVSGISSGGQMAHQLHIAYSDLFSGAAIIAGEMDLR